MEISALALLAMELQQIGSEHELTFEHLAWLKDALQPVISAYNPSGWSASCGELTRYQHYFILNGWAKRLNDKRQQFVSVGVNGECAFECFLADYPVLSGDAPKGVYGFRLSIDLDRLRHGINFITLTDFATGTVLAFKIFWHS